MPATIGGCQAGSVCDDGAMFRNLWLTIFLAGLITPTVAQPVDNPLSPNLQRFVGELNALIDEGERTRAADPALLTDLRNLSGRALARAPLGGGFPASSFRFARWVHTSTLDHVSSRPP